VRSVGLAVTTNMIAPASGSGTTSLRAGAECGIPIPPLLQSIARGSVRCRSA
jgi:hypothetical protein